MSLIRLRYDRVIDKASSEGVDRWPLLSRSNNRDVTCRAKKSKKRQDYGSGRARLGLDGAGTLESTSGFSAQEDRPALKEYLEFGKAIGEDIEDVTRQLEINGSAIKIDDESMEFLAKWQSEEIAAYEMFETLIDSAVDNDSNSMTAASAASAFNQRDTLLKNKNRSQASIKMDSLAPVRRKPSRSKEFLSAAERKLSRNRGRYNELSNMSALENVGLELIASSIDSTFEDFPALMEPPKRLYEHGEDLDYTDDDELWEAESTIQVDSKVETTPDPTYDDFEAALNTQKAKTKKIQKSNQVINVSFSTADKPIVLADKPIDKTSSKAMEAPNWSKSTKPKLNDKPRREESDNKTLLNCVEMDNTMKDIEINETPEETIRGNHMKLPPKNKIKTSVSTLSMEQGSDAALKKPEKPIQPGQKLQARVAKSTKPKQSSVPSTTQKETLQAKKPRKPSDASQARKIRSMQAALEAQQQGENVEALVWGNNSAGVLAQAGAITGFIPFSEFSQELMNDVLDAERLVIEREQTEDSSARRLALASLVGRSLIVSVEHVDEESCRVILSERSALRSMNRSSAAKEIDSKTLTAALKAVGGVFRARVRSIRPFGCFLDFEIPLQDGNTVTVTGLCHISEFTWDTLSDPSTLFHPGQIVEARLVFVNESKGRMFLSIRRAEPNPLLETLDSLLGASSVNSQRMSNSYLGIKSNDVLEGTVRTTADASEDLRPFLGDLDIAIAFAQEISKSKDVNKVILGKRLQSRAVSQEIQVFMPRSEDNEAGTGPMDVGNQGPCRRKLILRAGQDVQTVEVDTPLDRESLRELAVLVTQKLTDVL